MLHTLWEQEGLTHTELADRLQIIATTTAKMTRLRERADFILRRSDPEDQCGGKPSPHPTWLLKEPFRNMAVKTAATRIHE
jgi:hypothetical protein